MLLNLNKEVSLSQIVAISACRCLRISRLWILMHKCNITGVLIKYSPFDSKYLNLLSFLYKRYLKVEEFYHFKSGPLTTYLFTWSESATCTSRCLRCLCPDTMVISICPKVHEALIDVNLDGRHGYAAATVQYLFLQNRSINMIYRRWNNKMPYFIFLKHYVFNCDSTDTNMAIVAILTRTCVTYFNT